MTLTFRPIIQHPTDQHCHRPLRLFEKVSSALLSSCVHSPCRPDDKFVTHWTHRTLHSFYDYIWNENLMNIIKFNKCCYYTWPTNACQSCCSTSEYPCKVFLRLADNCLGPLLWYFSSYSFTVLNLGPEKCCCQFFPRTCFATASTTWTSLFQCKRCGSVVVNAIKLSNKQNKKKISSCTCTREKCYGQMKM